MKRCVIIRAFSFLGPVTYSAVPSERHSDKRNSHIGLRITADYLMKLELSKKHTMCGLNL